MPTDQTVIDPDSEPSGADAWRAAGSDGSSRPAPSEMRAPLRHIDGAGEVRRAEEDDPATQADRRAKYRDWQAPAVHRRGPRPGDTRPARRPPERPAEEARPG